MIKIIMYIFLLITSSCMRMGPPLIAPRVPGYNDFTETDNARISDAEDTLKTWEAVFDDPAIKELTKLGARQNFSLESALWRISESRARLQIATGEFFPQVQQAFGDYDVVRVSKNAPNRRFADKKFRNGLVGFTASWELDFWGKYRNGIYSANYALDASKADFLGVKLLLTSDIAKAYINLATAFELLRVTKENIKIQQRSMEIIRIRLEAGLVSELDLNQAQTLLSDTEAELPVVIELITNQKNALAVLLGITSDQIPSIVDLENVHTPKIPEFLAVGIPANLLTRRPDIMEAKQLILAQTALVGVAVTELLPQISIFGFIGFDAGYGSNLLNTNANKPLFSSDSLTYVFGPAFNWPLLNYGRIDGRIQLERARLKEFVANYRQLVLRAYREVEDALAAFIKTHDEKKYLEVGLNASIRAAELSELLYLEGVVDYERVLESQRSLLALQNQYAINNGNIALSFVQIYQALGGSVNGDCE